jgi:hypothetical protein
VTAGLRLGEQEHGVTEIRPEHSSGRIPFQLERKVARATTKVRHLGIRTLQDVAQCLRRGLPPGDVPTRRKEMVQEILRTMRGVRSVASEETGGLSPRGAFAASLMPAAPLHVPESGFDEVHRDLI